MTIKRSFKSLAGLGLAALVLAGCEGSGYVSSGVYYDSMMWNDYYYNYPNRPDRPDRPERPERPVHPIEPRPPVARPPIARPPVARPPVARPPIARPSPRR